MKTSLMLTSLLLLVSVGSAHAQTCTKASQHWEAIPEYHQLAWDTICDPSRLDFFQLQDCDEDFWTFFPQTWLDPARSTAAVIGMAALTFSTRTGSYRTWTGTIPVICVYTAGQNTETTGVPYIVHSPRYDRNDPTNWNASWLALSGSTSMCMGSGNDTAWFATTPIDCGPLTLQPINYNGWQFGLSGQEGKDYLTGGIGSDYLRGGNDADRMFGGSGADICDGGSGADNIYGDAGNDWLLGGTENDQLRDSSGSQDQLIGGDASDCFFDNDSLRVDGQAGYDICPPATRTGADTLVSCELSDGWCIPT